jgi:outer membrane protein assembly factor BamD (BamD/ComL family)
MNRRILVVSLILFVLIYANTVIFSFDVKDWEREKQKAELFYKQGKYEEAIIIFRDIALSSNNDDLKREMYFWLGKAYIGLNKLQQAEENLEYYIVNYKDNGLNYPEAFYEKGRLLFLQEQYQASIEQFNSFIQKYPNNELVSNAFYWIGESLYALGQFDDAVVYFNIVTTKYPKSIKSEACVYKIRLIEHKKSELVLQNLLKWSQEQYLASLNEFRIREKTLEEALNEYRKNGGTIINNDNLKELENENNALKEQIRKLEEIIKTYENNSSYKDLTDKLKQLELKEQLLKSKEETLKILEEELRKKEKALESK